MKHKLGILIPNYELSPTGKNILVVCLAAVALVGWMFSSIPFLPSPLHIWEAWKKLLFEQGLLFNLMVSLKLNLEAIILTTVISLCISYLSLMPVMRPVAEFISKLRYLGLVGLTLFFTMLTHSDHQFKLALLVFAMSVWFVTSMLTQLSSIPKEQYDHARTLGMNKWHIVYEVVVRGKADVVIDVLRENAAIGWMMLTMVEGLTRSEGGIGTLILNANKQMKIESTFAILITILVIGLLQDRLLVFVKHTLFPYSVLGKEKS